MMIDLPHDIPRGLLSRAIVYALAYVDSLPPQKRVPGERDHLVFLLHLITQDDAASEQLVEEVRRLTGDCPDLTDHQARPWKLM
jgi:hypothetical protein